ncbi:MAG: hypothetical protein V1742_05865 [Pseudomonadota bacterium]
MLEVKARDIFRATQPFESGNSGFLGFAPDGSAYHVVVPVDAQIARGVKAGNRPEDGTPFGGYRGWLYFECLPFLENPGLDRGTQTKKNAERLLAWAAEHGLELRIVECDPETALSIS